MIDKKPLGMVGGRVKMLLFFLLLYIFCSPFLAPYKSLNVIAHGLLSIVLVAAGYAVWNNQEKRSFVLLLLPLVLILYWLGIYDVIDFSRQVSYLLFTLFYGLLVYSFVSQIARVTNITADVLAAALCLYLIIGLFWGALYTLMYELIPGSYAGVLLDNVGIYNLHVFNYFSFVTLTTLGYGDITPHHPGAASLCQMEAIIGQFFTAVVVAWLVGNFVADRNAGDSSAED